ncbi:uncharacterized protein TNCV_4447511 [Trichonephila clavipes]|nr:uncharacterized protein TNCV_4447511 [Trichonephila clavipes]
MRNNLSSDDNRFRVWRPRRERLNPVFTLQRYTAPTAGVMVGGTIAENTRSPIALMHGTVTAQRFTCGWLVEGEAERERNRSDVTRARVEERREGAKSPLRVREAPKRSREKECCNFFPSQNEKERCLEVELANATAGGRNRSQLLH